MGFFSTQNPGDCLLVYWVEGRSNVYLSFISLRGPRLDIRDLRIDATIFAEEKMVWPWRVQILSIRRWLVANSNIFFFIPNLGEMIQFDYFWNGLKLKLKPPPRICSFVFSNSQFQFLRVSNVVEATNLMDFLPSSYFHCQHTSGGWCFSFAGGLCWVKVFKHGPTDESEPLHALRLVVHWLVLGDMTHSYHNI